MIGIGIAGYGYWGPNMARAVSETEEAELIAIADRSGEALARAGRRYPAARLMADCMEMIADPAVDAVVIATPVVSHYPLALAALRAGKHVLIEKPMTDNPAHAAHLVEEAAARRLTLMVDHTFCYTPAVQKIASLIEDGEIGDVYYYDSTRVNLGLFRHDVDVIWDLAVHDFAILDFLLKNKPVAISASSAGFLPENQDNMAHLSIFFDNGALAHLNVNWLAPVKIRQTVIGGSRRMVIYDDMQTSEKLKVYDRGAACSDAHAQMVNYRMGEMWSPALSSKEALVTEIQHFAAAVAEGRPTATDGQSGLRVVEMLTAATRSTRMRGFPVDLVTLKEAS